MRMAVALFSAVILGAMAAEALAEPPAASYIYPAGGQRGTKVSFRVGGMFLYDQAPLEMLGPGVAASGIIKRTETTWFEGPLIRQPASQAAENYPKDYVGDVQIAADAALGFRRWRVWNAQGVTPLVRFVIGDLPEVVENELEGEPIPVSVALPVTINGRIFPREDVDVWTFDAAAGQSITCSLAAAEFGSSLKGRLEVRSPSGKPLAETTGTSAGDVRLRFVAAETGIHEVRIHDIQFGGLQTYVYRVTVTSGPWLDSVYPLGGQRGTEVKLEGLGQNLGGPLTAKMPEIAPGVLLHAFDHSDRALNPIRFDVDELPEALEAEPNNGAVAAKSVAVPVVVNGRIDQPGDKDTWQLPLTKGQALRIESRSALLGSPVAVELVLRDEMGKELARADALDANGDPTLTFTAPADGKYQLEIGERFASRGGAPFAYRVRIAPPKKTPDFEVVIPDSIALEGEGPKNLEVQILRSGDFKGPITLHVDGLPGGITAEDVKVPEGAPKAAIALKPAANLPVLTALLKVTGAAEIEGKPAQRIGHVAAIPGDAAVEELRLVTTLKTPFRLRGTYDLRFAARGTVLKKKYFIDRGGFEGALEARLADKQGRHLQGVSGPVITIPPGVSEFEYPLTLAPWMELSRTSRTNLMLT
ncbi:MAG TPA: PPC domain-containing protein, partial [Pirellulaceae bacterium]|nr:PPC domain-containing protein [Pirellulaceae bacterium]